MLGLPSNVKRFALQKHWQNFLMWGIPTICKELKSIFAMSDFEEKGCFQFGNNHST